MGLDRAEFCHFFNCLYWFAFGVGLSSTVGFHLGFFSSKIIAYADDIVLLSPSLTGLQHLINIAISHSNLLKFLFTPKKHME